MSDAAPIAFLFDYLSPFAYLAWTELRTIATRHRREIEPVPVLLAGLLSAHGTKGPAEVPAKREYIYRHVLRVADRLAIPFAPPPTHPFRPLAALRASSVALPREQRLALVDRLFAATWGGAGGGVETDAAVLRCANDAGLDGDAIVREASSEETKARLRKATDDAIAAGVFGVPTMIVEGALFWGFDALPDLERALEGNDPVTPDAVARWATLMPSATRRS